MRHSEPPLVVGHRGASGYRPEHTRSAYELAIALGADALEPDLVATKDGILVLRHENEISGTTDVADRPEFAALRTTKTIDGRSLTGWFTEDFTWAELSTLRARERLGTLRTSSASFDGQFPILRMVDLFEILDRAREDIGRPIGLVAEIKHATYFDSIGLPLDALFALELERAGWAPRDERLVIESFEKTVLDAFAVRGIGAKRIYLIEAAGAPADLVARDGRRAADYASVVTDAGLRALGRDGGPMIGVDGISVDKSMLLSVGRGGAVGTTDLVDRAHAAGLEVFTWTLRPENRFLVKPFRHGSDPAAFGSWRDEFSLILDTGVDGVFADHPDLVRDLLAER